QVTREVVERAHAVGVTVEGEIGTLGGIEDGVGSGEIHLTDPDQAVEFVEATGIDALAVAIGTSHGAYKFTRKPDGAVLAMNLIQEIHEKLPTTHLVMHGSSSVPKDLVDLINQYGGEIREAVAAGSKSIRGIPNVAVIELTCDVEPGVITRWNALVKISFPVEARSIRTSGKRGSGRHRCGRQPPLADCSERRGHEHS